jgi:transcriptional regulator with XRE-family HTH domain/mannose-6-phosphate isomerase-like protein (cupin superfamily)
MTDVVVDRSAEGVAADPVVNLGSRLKDVRLRSGMSLREVARQLGVSPSFISQMENGKSQPSVATLYSMAQLLDVSIDELFAKDSSAKDPGAKDRPGKESSTPVPSAVVDPVHGAVNRSDFSSPADVWDQEGSGERISIVTPEDRPRLVMDSGVIWEQLASSSERNLDFMEIIYPAGASSTNDGRMLRHEGREYGYLLSGTLEITFGFDTYTLRPGESMSLDPSVPHLLTNPGTEAARGIWVVDHRAPVGREGTAD